MDNGKVKQQIAVPLPGWRTWGTAFLTCNRSPNGEGKLFCLPLKGNFLISSHFEACGEERESKRREIYIFIYIYIKKEERKEERKKHLCFNGSSFL